MTTEAKIVPGSKVMEAINRLLGSWLGKIAEAEEEFGERGRMMAYLRWGQVIQGRKSIMEGFLQKAGFPVERALYITQQPDTYRGRLGAVRLLLEALRLDACPTFLKQGRCWKQECQLKHEFPA